MSMAEVQGCLWGAQARDYAALVEGFFRPLYDRVLDESGVERGTRLLDVACGSGLASVIFAGSIITSVLPSTRPTMEAACAEAPKRDEAITAPASARVLA